MFGQQGPQKQRSTIDCTVSNCTHHGSGNCCNAHAIRVGTEYAMDKTETFCSTFEQRSGI